MRFLEGSLLITVAIDRTALARMFNLKGFKVEFLDDPVHFMQIQKDKDSPLRISTNFIGRGACEFLSLNWMVEELTQQYSTVMAEIEERGAAV